MGVFFFSLTSFTQCTAPGCLLFVLVQVSTANGMKLLCFHGNCAHIYFVDMLAMLLSCQMINDDLAGMESNLEFFSDFHPKNQFDQHCNFTPYWLVMFCLW